MRHIIAGMLASAALSHAALTGAAWAGVPQVVTDILPVHALAAAVMEGVGEPVLLLDPGTSPHGFQMRPSQAAAVAGADLVIWVGPELSPWLEGGIAMRPEGAQVLGLLAGQGVHRRSYLEGAEADGDAAHGDHAPAEADHAHDDQSQAGTDPHAWLNPENGIVWLGLIAAELALLDPDHAAAYSANAARAADDIRAADAAAAALLAPVRDRPLVVFHDAYGYFADHYGLTLAGSIALGDATSPGARRLAELQAGMAGPGPLCIFPEALHDPALVAQMAEATGARVGGALDPEGASLPPGRDAYGALLTGMATTIAACLAG